jgi:hypothetical protein
MNALFVASHSTTSSTGSVRLKRNDAASASQKSAPSGSVTECSRSSMARTSSGVRMRPALPSPSRGSLTPGSRSRSSSATQSCPRSRLVQTTPSRPPGRSTRAISGTARAGSSQCQAVDTNTASAYPSGSGISSPQPSSTRTRGDCLASTARIRASGSIATTWAARGASARVNSPVPAARSTASRQPAGTSQSSASAGGPGRTRS